MPTMQPRVEWDTGMPPVYLYPPDEDTAQEKALYAAEPALVEALACLQMARDEYEAEYIALTGAEEVDMPDDLSSALNSVAALIAESAKGAPRC